MSRTRIAVMAAVLALVVASGAAWAVNVPKTPLAFDPPPSWTINDTGLMGTYVIYLDSPRDGFSANLNVLSESMAGLSLDAYMDLSLKNLKDAIGDFDLKERQALTVNGMEAVGIVYTGKSNNLKLIWYQLFISYQGHAYIFTGTTLRKYGEEYIPVFKRTFSTVRPAGSSPNYGTPPPTYQPDYGTPTPPKGGDK